VPVRVWLLLLIPSIKVFMVVLSLFWVEGVVVVEVVMVRENRVQ